MPRKIIDFHTHIFPDNLARKAMLTMAERSYLPFYSDGSAEGLIKSMKEAEITHSVVCNIAVKPGQSENVLRFAIETKEKYQTAETPCLIPFGSVHPFEPDWKEQLNKVRKNGLYGIKLHPDYQGFYINDPAMEPFYLEAIRLGLVMVFHAGVDAGYPEPVHADVRRIMDVLPVLEKGKVILAHMGGYLMERETLKYLCRREVYFDTSYNLDKLEIETAREIIRRHSPERLVFGTDTPWVDMKCFVDYFDNTIAKGFLSEADSNRILWDNAAGLLGLGLTNP